QTASDWAEMMYDRHPLMRAQAIVALVAIGEPSLPHFTKALKDGDAKLKFRVREVMAEMGPSSVPYFKEAIMTDDLQTRFEAAVGLCRVAKDQQLSIDASLPKDCRERKRAVWAMKLVVEHGINGYSKLAVEFLPQFPESAQWAIPI